MRKYGQSQRREFGGKWVYVKPISKGDIGSRMDFKIRSSVDNNALVC